MLSYRLINCNTYAVSYPKLPGARIVTVVPSMGAFLTGRTLPPELLRQFDYDEVIEMLKWPVEANEKLENWISSLDSTEGVELSKVGTIP